jgi:hypothetical protein
MAPHEGSPTWPRRARRRGRVEGAECACQLHDLDQRDPATLHVAAPFRHPQPSPAPAARHQVPQRWQSLTRRLSALLEVLRAQAGEHRLLLLAGPGKRRGPGEAVVPACIGLSWCSRAVDERLAARHTPLGRPGHRSGLGRRTAGSRWLLMTDGRRNRCQAVARAAFAEQGRRPRLLTCQNGRLKRAWICPDLVLPRRSPHR